MDPIQREKTPTQETTAVTLKNHSSTAAVPSKGSLVFYDPVLSAALRSTTRAAGHSGENPDDLLDAGGGGHSIPGDATGEDTPDLLHSNMSDPGKAPGSHPRRSQNQSQSNSFRRPPVTPRPPPSHVFPISSQNPVIPQENIHHSSGHSSSFQTPPSQYQAPPSPYNQRNSYVGQYTMSPQPPMSVGRSHTPYGYPHGFHPGVHGQPDNNMLPQNIHVGYQPMMQPPHGPVYQFQRHSPEGSAPSHPTYSNSSTSSLYGHPHLNSSPPPHSPLPTQSPTGQSAAAHSANYTGQTGPFRSLNFPSPMSTPPYPYQTQSFGASPPMYPSQYAPSPYPQHFTGTSDQEGQGTWWYLPHGPPLAAQQYEGVQRSYQGHYPMGYPQIGHRSEVESSYTSPGAGPSSAATYHPISPSAQHLAVSSNEAPSSPSSSAAGVASPVMQSKPEPSASTGASKHERPVIRRAYHPNPPAQRSEWVMWAGNVPSDTTHDELWRFFNQPSPAPSRISPSSSTDPPPQSDDQVYGGVISIFLISRSNCAFVNFETEHHLQAAITRFNGQPLRSNDTRCPRLVCRVRRKDDDLKAGVGGQRGMGMHMRWIKDQTEKNIDSASPATTFEGVSTSPSIAEHLASAMAQMSVSSDDEGVRHPGRRVEGHSSSSGSYASTNSSTLTRHFPKRYFILKSLTQFDLDLSVEKGLWATQKHNEGILDQAYRTSTEVYLIFGVNKSGEFYGYARMAGPVLQGGHRVSWATRSTDSPGSSRSSMSPATGRGSIQSETIPEEPDSPSHPPSRQREAATFFSPDSERLVEQSPLPFSPSNPQAVQRRTSGREFVDDEAAISGMRGGGLQSAPAELGRPHQKFTMQTPRVKHSLDVDKLRPAAPTLLSTRQRPEEFELDPSAPGRHIRGSRESIESLGEHEGQVGSPSLPKVEEEEEVFGTEGVAKGEEEAGREEGWGESFRIEWICTKRLPFYRTRHLRNPWNHDREVKVSRDGTELEPGVGQKLLEEWERLSEPQPQSATPGRRGGIGNSKSAPPMSGVSTVPREAPSRS